jgi:multidrug efflux pump subunit AcrB
MGLVKKQFFPTSDRPEVLVEVQMPYGTSIEETSATTAKVEAWLQQQKEAKIVTAYIGQGYQHFRAVRGRKKLFFNQSHPENSGRKNGNNRSG